VDQFEGAAGRRARRIVSAPLALIASPDTKKGMNVTSEKTASS
jgi:hypothetical protein